jgi:hypothetical protein
MSLRVNDVVAALALSALVNATPTARADEVGFGQHQWVPSLAVTSGAVLQNQSAFQNSFLYDGEAADPTQPIPLRKPDSGDDRAVAPFVGGAVELMTPSLLPRLRFFASLEVLPIFAPERHLTDEGQPGLITGPEVGAVPALEEDNEHFTIPRTQPRVNPFGAIDAKGQGARASAQIDQLSYGAKIGLAWSFEYRGRQMRLKPSVGWFHYRLGVKGFLVHPECFPTNRCTNIYTTTGNLVAPGFLRVPFTLKGRDAGIFDGVGPNVDLEMDTGRYGPLVTSLFVGFGGYYIPGDRDIHFSARKKFDDALGQDTRVAQWNVRVSPWIYRAGVGIRFQWLGEGD